MANERLTTSLSESILTVLSFSDHEKADLIANLVRPDLFETYYKNICTKVLEYRQQFKQPPGPGHLDDLLDGILSDPKHKLHDIYQKILTGLYEQNRSGINVDYVASRVSEFVRFQTLKQGILEAAQRIQQGGESSSEDVERILLNTVQKKVNIDDPGTYLGDKERALRFLNENNNDYCQIGIKELDKRRLCPTRKELCLFVAARKRGKSFFAIHIGKLASLQRWKVLHITLEMSEEIVLQRYFQTLFSISKRNETSVTTFFERDELGRLSGLDVQRKKAKLNFEDPKIRKKLSMKLDEWGLRLNNVIVKQFPTGSLTVPQLESYIDSIEIAEKFIPDLIIVDYPQLMKLSTDNYTNSLGQTVVGLRGIAVKHNAAMLVLAQGNRASEDSKQVGSHQIGYDVSMVATCDLCITYSQTPAEKTLGLARLFVANARNDEDRFTVLASQNYATGQFCIDSAMINSNYHDLVEVTSGRLDDAAPEL